MSVDELLEWVRDIVGDTSATLRQRPGGGRHQAWDVDVDGRPRWFLRMDHGAPAAHEHYTLRRESDIYRVVHESGLPSPAVLGVHPRLEAVLLERIDGDAAFAKLDHESQTAVIDDFAPIVARLHAITPPRIESLGTAVTIREAVVAELDIWESRLDSTGVPDPFLSSCFRWLRRNIPDTGAEPAVLVQGDTGPGNFLHDGRRVTALLDFELAHLGDPVEDIAWVGTRNAQEPVPDFRRFVASYEQASGRRVDRHRFLYHSLFAELRIAVLGANRDDSPRSDLAEHGIGIIYGALHRRLTVEALAAVLGRPMPDVRLIELRDGPDTYLYDGVLAQLATFVVPAIADPLASRRAKGLARVVKHLREIDRSGGQADELELDDLATLLGHRPGSTAEGRRELQAQVDAGRLDAADLLPYGAAQALRRQQLAAPAMGVLAQRHLPQL